MTRALRLLAPSRVVAHALNTYLRVSEERITWLPSVPPAGFQRARRPEVCRDEALPTVDKALVMAVTARSDIGVVAA